MKKVILIVATILFATSIQTNIWPISAQSCDTCGAAGNACCPIPCGIGSCKDGSVCAGVGLCPQPECSSCGGPNQPCCNAYCNAKIVTLGSGGCKTASYACSSTTGLCIVPTPTVSIPTPVVATPPMATVAPPDPSKCQISLTGSCPIDFPHGCGGSRPGYCCVSDADCKPYPNALNPFCLDGNGVQTGLGCLDITGKNTIQTLLNWGVIIGGGIAFILILVASIQITTAQGDAKRVAAGKELLFATLGGIFLFATAIVLLNFIGVNILGLDQLGFKTS